MPRWQRRRIAAVLAALGLAAGTPASGFSLFPYSGTDPETALESAARWADGFGLEDGIQVGIQPGLVQAIAIGALTPTEIADFEAGIVTAFSTWENSALQFDITFDAPTTVGNSSGFEIDVIALPDDHPVWAGTGAIVGLASPNIISATRTLTNGMSAYGDVIVGADIYLNFEAMRAIGHLLDLEYQESLDAFIRLMMHEIGHTLGLGHPDSFANFDTDFDPFNPMPIDPLDPFSALVRSGAIDDQAIMTNRPCGPDTLFCAATAFTALRSDDLGGRDALYPVVPEPGSGALLAIGFGACVAARRRARRFSA